MSKLHEFQTEIVRITKEKGWYDVERSFTEEIALLHSEVAEMFEAYRSYGFDDATGPAPELIVDGVVEEGLAKPEGVGSEAADVLIRLLDTCARYKVDLDKMVADTGFQAIADTQTVADMDFAGAIALLHKTIADEQKGTEITFGSKLYCLLEQVCYVYNLDLVAETERKIAYNATRGYRHGGKRV